MKKALKPAQLREEVETLQVCYAVSKQRACNMLKFQRSSCYYRSVANEQAALRIRIRDLAHARVSYGYRRIHLLLEREGWKVNHKRVYRLYKQEGLIMRTKRSRRHVTARHKIARHLSKIANSYQPLLSSVSCLRRHRPA